MTPAEFTQRCKDLCPHCAAGAAVRQRLDTFEFVHDTAVDIPGVIGKRMGHAYCTATEFRKAHTGEAI